MEGISLYNTYTSFRDVSLNQVCTTTSFRLDSLTSAVKHNFHPSLLTDHILYKTTNTINGKFYVGVHCQPENQTEFDGYFGSGIRIKYAIRKYGKENFVRTTLFTNLEKGEAYLKEFEVLSGLSKRFCYNLHEGGRGGFEGRVYPKFGRDNPSSDYAYFLNPEDFLSRPTKLIKGLEPPGWFPSIRIKGPRDAYAKKVKAGLAINWKEDFEYYFKSLPLPALLSHDAKQHNLPILIQE